MTGRDVSAQAIAANRREARDDLVARIREGLRDWFEESTVLHPLPHGSFFEQVRNEVSRLEAEVDPNGERAWKIERKKVPAALRGRVFKRDRHTCQTCGWQRPRDPEEIATSYRSGRFLVAELIIPQQDGGKRRIENLRTICSFCVRQTRGMPSRPGVEQPKNPKHVEARPEVAE